MKPMKPTTRKAVAMLTMVGSAAVNDETHDEKGSGNVDDGRASGGKR